MVQLSQSQDDEIGDGTTGVVGMSQTKIRWYYTIKLQIYYCYRSWARGKKGFTPLSTIFQLYLQGEKYLLE
jgi:hypothetical protein